MLSEIRGMKYTFKAAARETDKFWVLISNLFEILDGEYVLLFIVRNANTLLRNLSNLEVTLLLYNT